MAVARRCAHMILRRSIRVREYFDRRPSSPSSVSTTTPAITKIWSWSPLTCSDGATSIWHRRPCSGLITRTPPLRANPLCGRVNALLDGGRGDSGMLRIWVRYTRLIAGLCNHQTYTASRASARQAVVSAANRPVAVSGGVTHGGWPLGHRRAPLVGGTFERGPHRRLVAHARGRQGGKTSRRPGSARGTAPVGKADRAQAARR